MVPALGGLLRCRDERRVTNRPWDPVGARPAESNKSQLGWFSLYTLSWIISDGPLTLQHTYLYHLSIGLPRPGTNDFNSTLTDDPASLIRTQGPRITAYVGTPPMLSGASWLPGTAEVAVRGLLSMTKPSPRETHTSTIEHEKSPTYGGTPPPADPFKRDCEADTRHQVSCDTDLISPK